MLNKIKNNKGITLVSLVITIIVMLILAGVSLSMVTGDSSVLKQAQKTAFMQEMAKYKEELESEILGKSAEYYATNLKHLDKSTITLAGTNMREYIPSMTDEDINDYMIVGGVLHYIGDDEFEYGICTELGYDTRESNKTSEEFRDQVECEALESIIKKMAGVVMTKTDESGKEVTVGWPLAKKTSSSGFGSAQGSWKIITELENDVLKSTYADGWYFVEQGEKIKDIGELKHSYIINYDTNKAVRFDAKKHSIIASNGGLAVTDGLVYNADPSNMVDPDTNSTSWNGATLHGFTTSVKDASGKVVSGWSDTAFITDGVNDAVAYNIPSNVSFNTGLTIEFYGKIHKLSSTNEAVVFAKKVVDEVNDRRLMLGLWTNTNTFWFGYSGHRHWSTTNIANTIANDFYLTLTYSPDNVDKLYLNAEELQKSSVNGGGSITWTGVRDMLNESGIPFVFGDGMRTSSKKGYVGESIYSIRVYNKALTPDEILANYNATVSYHNILVNGGEAGNNNTGGDDLGSIE